MPSLPRRMNGRKQTCKSAVFRYSCIYHCVLKHSKWMVWHQHDSCYLCSLALCFSAIVTLSHLLRYDQPLLYRWPLSPVEFAFQFADRIQYVPWVEKDVHVPGFAQQDFLCCVQIFALVDADGSGQISMYEAKHLLNLIGEQVELSDVENLISEFDLDGNGEVCWSR